MSVTISPSAASSNSEDEEAKRPRLDFLDGIRGLAALYVAQFHIVQHPFRNRALLDWLSYAHYAVATFIVLSGFCLMLPVACSATGTLKGGVIGYLKRRAWRIIPPYYVALAVCLILKGVTLLIKHTPLQSDPGSDWTLFAPENLLLHLTLLHNLSLHWSQAIDPPMWTVGLEWQIYFLFPLFLLPLWRRTGAVVTMVVAVLLSAAPHFLLKSIGNMDYTAPWFAGLFAMGMAGAAIRFSTHPAERRLRDRLPWGVIAVLFGITFVMLIPALHHPRNLDLVCLADLAIGLSITCLIITCSNCSAAGVKPLVLRLLSSQPCVRLGQFSYSLYLMHLPAYWMIQPVFRALHASGVKLFLLQLTIGLPFAIGVSYLFYLLFERRFISASARNRTNGK